MASRQAIEQGAEAEYIASVAYRLDPALPWDKLPEESRARRIKAFAAGVRVVEEFDKSERGSQESNQPPRSSD
jgi:hypothetical protein